MQMPYTLLLPDTCQISADARSFEDHYFTCRHCAAAVERAERYVRAMIGAEQMLSGGNPTIN